jgi:GntR family phosphonate transport system transcriptional regulator
VWRAETLGVADGVPLGHSFHYFDAVRFPAMEAALREEGSITRALARLGVTDYVRRTTRISAHLSDAEDAGPLEIAPRRPILQTENVNVDADGRPLEYGISRFPGDRLQVVVERSDFG